MKEVKRLRDWYFVKYRSAKSNQLRVYTPRVKLIAEVYSKKTGKRVGTINKVKDGKPIARKFSKKAKLLYHESVKPSKSRIEKSTGRHFTINYSKWVVDQIPEWVGGSLNYEIDSKGYVEFLFRMTGHDNKGLFKDIKTETKAYVNEKTNPEWNEIASNLIIAALRDNQIRTSPKKHIKTNQYYRSKKGTIAEFHYMKKYRVELVLRQTNRRAVDE